MNATGFVMLHLRHSAEARDLKMASDRDFSSIAEMMEWRKMTNSVSNEILCPLAVLRLFFPPKHFTPREMLSSLRHSHGREMGGPCCLDKPKVGQWTWWKSSPAEKFRVFFNCLDFATLDLIHQFLNVFLDVYCFGQKVLAILDVFPSKKNGKSKRWPREEFRASNNAGWR